MAKKPTDSAVEVSPPVAVASNGHDPAAEAPAPPEVALSDAVRLVGQLYGALAATVKWRAELGATAQQQAEVERQIHERQAMIPTLDEEIRTKQGRLDLLTQEIRTAVERLTVEEARLRDVRALRDAAVGDHIAQVLAEA